VRIGVISDTHMPAARRELWDEVIDAFAGVDLILHAGDIQLPMVLDQLEAIAPTLAARGNNDMGWDDPRLEDAHWLDIEGYRLVVVHDMEPEDEPLQHLRDKFLKGEPADIMVTGHTHVERLDWRGGVLQVNPGSATHPRLWSTRLGTVALIDVAPGRLRAEVVRLGELDGLRNPGVEYVFDGEAVHRR
jgi:putative phosphoesterase